MKRFSMLMAALLATAAIANGQSLSGTAVQTFRNGDGVTQSPPFVPPPPVFGQLPQSLDIITNDADECCSEQNWYTQAVKHSLAAWQRVRALCASRNQAIGYGEGVTVCQATSGSPVGTAKGVQAPTGTLVLGVGVGVGCQSCPLRDLAQCCPLGFTQANPAAPCCCAKACACCEMCKSKSVAGLNPQPTRGATMPAQPWTGPAPQGWALPIPPPPASRVVVGLPTSGSSAKPAHLVTPDLEAHCQRITNRGEVMILEGNVLLLVKKHAQPLRIEAQRVFVNLGDGSFTVESAQGVPPMPPVLRMSMPAQPQPTWDLYYPAVTRESSNRTPPLPVLPTPQRIIEIPVGYPR